MGSERSKRCVIEHVLARAERVANVRAWHKTIGVWLKKGSVTSEALVS
jgi:hypothetical protein